MDAAIGFTIVLAFASPAGGIQTFTMPCPTMACVERIERLAHGSVFLERFQVYRNDRYGRIVETGQTAFPPIIDWHPS